MKGRVKRCFLLGFMVFFAAVFFVCGSAIYQQFQEYDTSNDLYDNLASQYSPVLHQQDMAVLGIEKTPVYVSPVDFEALWKINPDTVGWITISGTTVDYPVVRGQDNERYLTTSFDGQHNSSGTLFMDYLCSPDFSDEHIIIYGHNMKNGSMLAALDQFKIKSFFDSNREIILYTPKTEYRLVVLSCDCAGADDRMRTFAFETRAAFVKYMKTAMNASRFLADTDLNQVGKLISLGTCSYEWEDARTWLHLGLLH